MSSGYRTDKMESKYLPRGTRETTKTARVRFEQDIFHQSPYVNLHKL